MISARDKLWLATEMKRCGAYLTGDFELSSGKRSDTYLDCRMLTLGSNLDIVISMVTDVLKFHKYPVDCVGGMSSGADPLIAGCLMTGYCKGGFFTRKEKKAYGTERLIEGHLKAGNQVALLDDVATSGRSLVKTAIDVREHGGEILCAVVVVDREEGAKYALAELNIPLYSLITLQEIKSILLTRDNNVEPVRLPAD